jgi:hypothetical protein
MNKIDWKSKLSSRKFWAMIGGFVTGLLVAFNVPNATTTQVVAIIGSFGSIICYILAEGKVDSAGASSNTTSEITSTINKN